MNRRIIIIAFLVCLALGSVLVGFALHQWNPDPGSVGPATVADLEPWLQPVPMLDWGQWQEIEPKTLAVIPELSRAEAIQRLDDSSISELNDADLIIFAPTCPTLPAGYRPYLVRGVFFKQQGGNPMGTGHFYAYHRGQEVL